MFNLAVTASMSALLKLCEVPLEIWSIYLMLIPNVLVLFFEVIYLASCEIPSWNSDKIFRRSMGIIYLMQLVIIFIVFIVKTFK